MRRNRRNALCFKVRPVEALETRDLFVFRSDETRPIERRFADTPAEARRILEIAAKARSIDEKLLRHAAADHARTAEPVGLRNGNLRAIPRSDPGGPHAP